MQPLPTPDSSRGLSCDVDAPSGEKASDCSLAFSVLKGSSSFPVSVLRQVRIVIS
jgi:hypothetical protein